MNSGATRFSKRCAIGSAVCGVMLVGMLVAGCGTTSTSSIEGETHWLSRCSDSQPCKTSLQCVCGVCTRTCSEPSQCVGLPAQAVCAAPASTAFSDECSEPPPEGLCVPPTELEAASSQAAASTGSGGTGSSSGSASNTGGAQGGAGAAVTSQGGTTGEATSSGLAGAGGALQDDCQRLPGLVPGCECWTDADCGSGELCYFADCAGGQTGECRTPPVNGCYEDRDCAEGSCIGARPVGCATAGPETVGVCTTDPCPPEAPCEAGQSSGDGCRCFDGNSCAVATGPIGSGFCRGSDGSCTVCRCAAPDTPIATPSGPRAISELQVGDLVFSVDGAQIVPVPVLALHRMKVFAHHVLRVEFADGARFEMSGEHPTLDGRLLSELTVGMTLDGKRITRIQRIPYLHTHTYDILPDSLSGGYFASGVLVGSTLGRGR